MRNKKHSYYKDDMRRILLLYAIVPVALLTLVCLFLFWGTWRYSLEKNNRNDNTRIAADVETTVAAYIKLAEEFAQQSNILSSDLDVGKRVEIFEKIYKISNELDRKAYLYVFDRNFLPVISSTKTVPEYLDGNYYANWGIFRIMNQAPQDAALKLVADDTTDSEELVIGKAIVNGGEIEGYVIFALDSRQYQKQIADQESQTVITDENGGVFLNNNYSFLNNLNRFALSGQTTTGNIENDYGKYYVTSTSLFNNRIYIYSLSPLSSQTTVFLSIFLILFFVFFMMILAVFISTKKMAAKKTRDLYTIIEAFEKVKKGNLDTYVDISSNDELAVIGESYNVMISSLNEQKDRNKEMGLLVTDSQTKQLESQFDPHFLFNTLENIRFMCKLDPQSASKMIFNLATLLRYSISNTQEEVSVKDDIFYTKNYMSILKYRFNDHFHYKIDLPEELQKCIIPKLIVQPMIENSIKYGFVGKENLSIRISGYIEDGKLVLICTDDGAGIKAEDLTEIRQIMMQNTNMSSHSGLYNIHRRVQLRYGGEYGIHIDSVQGHGTSIKVVLPAKYVESMGGC